MFWSTLAYKINQGNFSYKVTNKMGEVFFPISTFNFVVKLLFPLGSLQDISVQQGLKYNLLLVR
jgi:hypothetical protein